MKPNRAIGDSYKFKRNRIVEVDDGREAASSMIDDISNLDMKYELFCKWLRQNEQDPLLTENREVNSSTILTEDEVSSFATNSDDSEGDVFLDTESDFPSIILSSDNDEQIQLNAVSDFANSGIDSMMGEFRVDTPSQLSVSDYDCSSSDITVSSKISGSSSQLVKRKAKHKKGKAPPIPVTALNSTNNSDDHNNNESATTELINNMTNSNDTPSNTRSARETDI